MANDRSDFDDAVRNAAWWSSDSRLAAQGRANEAVMQKLGLMEKLDLSANEAVQMGHVMQPVIGRLASERLRLNLKDADYMMTHSSEPWLKSHFDFIDESGTHLVEAKNYGAHKQRFFDSGANIVPAEDMAQLIHEATVHNVEKITLAVLFGGQNFETFSFTIHEAQKVEFIQDMAKNWAAVATRTPLPAESPEQARALYAVSSPRAAIANSNIEKAAQALKAIKNSIKEYETKEKELQAYLADYMKDCETLQSVDGSILATWKSPKPSMTFDASLFKSSMPDIYNQFVVEKSGSRRFLIK
jgi:predicted phage-related endonuclease